MKTIIKSKSKLFYKFGFITSSLLNIGAMESNGNTASTNNIKTFSDTKNVKEQEDNNNKSHANIENKNSIIIEKSTSEPSKLISYVDCIREMSRKGNYTYSSLDLLDDFQNDSVSLNKWTNNQNEVKYILSAIYDIFESRRLLSIEDFREIIKFSEENKLDELIDNEASYLNSEIFNGKFFYNFDDNTYDKIEIATTFKVFGNIFRKVNSIKNIFTDVFKKDLYFILCDRNANDKSLYKLISRKLKKYEKKPEDFKGFDKNYIEFYHDSIDNINPFSEGFDVFLVISLYECSKDNNYKGNINNTFCLYRILPDCINEFNNSAFRVFDLFSHYSINNQVLKIYSLAWEFSHEFFHSLERCVTSLLFNTKFSYIANNRCVSNKSAFNFICESIISNNINSNVVKFFKEKILNNDKNLEDDFTNYLTKIKFLDKFKKDQYLKKNYHTLYMFDNYKKLDDLFSFDNNCNIEYGNVKKYIFYLYFFDKFNNFNIFNDDNLKQKLRVLYEEITKIGKTLPGIKNTQDRVDIKKKLYSKLDEYYNNFMINCSDLNYRKEINTLYETLISKNDYQLILDLTDKSNHLSNFDLQYSLFNLLDIRRKNTEAIKKLTPELNIDEFLAESFAFSLLPDIFHAGPTSVVFCYFKYIEYVYNSYIEFCKQNDKDKILFDEIINNFQKNN